MTMHRTSPIYRAINKPLTIGGVERWMFGIAMIGGLMALIAFGMTAATLTFALLFFSARRVTKDDHQMPRIFLAARRFRNVYDPAKREWYPIR